MRIHDWRARTPARSVFAEGPGESLEDRRHIAAADVATAEAALTAPPSNTAAADGDTGNVVRMFAWDLEHRFRIGPAALPLGKDGQITGAQPGCTHVVVHAM